MQPGPRSVPGLRRARRRVATSAVVAALVVVPLLATIGPAPTPAGAATRPNILVIVTDDQRADTLGVMDATLRWFADGSRYTNAVATTPLCCPSRASIFTGRLAHNHGVRTNSSREQTGALDQRGTIQAYLDGAGYRTALVGKYFNAWPLATPPPYFDRFSFMTSSSAYWSPRMNVDGTVAEVPGYTTDVLADRAMRYLEAFERNDTEPWFLYVAPVAPHDPYGAENAYADADVGAWSGNPAVWEWDRSDKPAVVRARSDGVDAGRTLRAQQLRTLLSVDDMVASITERMATLGEGDTLTIYTSDNGYLWSEHGVNGQKRLPYLQSVEIPLLARWPGHVPASIDDRLVATVDLVPTVLDAAGVVPNAALPPLDGRSLLAAGARDRIQLEYFRSPDATSYPSWAATLTPTWQYVEYYGQDLQTIRFAEYYDLAADPWQNENLLADAIVGNEPDVTALSRSLAVDRACRGASCVGPVVPDTVAPSAPTGLSATPGIDGVTLRWGASSDAIGVVGYRIRRNGSPRASVGAVTTFTDRSAAAGQTHRYVVRAFDRAGNLSPRATVDVVL